MDELWIDFRTVEQADIDRAPDEADAFAELCDMIDGGAFDGEPADVDGYVPLDLSVPDDGCCHCVTPAPDPFGRRNCLDCWGVVLPVSAR